MSTKTERTVEGEEVIVGGIPVSIELDRGELRIHIGNSPEGGTRVRVTASGANGGIGGSCEMTAYALRNLEESRRRYQAGGLARVLGEPWEREDQTLEDTGPR